MKPCEVCNGKGFTLPDGRPVNSFDGSDLSDVRTCRRCGGEGRLSGRIPTPEPRYLDTFTVRRGFTNSGLFTVSDGTGYRAFNRKELLSWLRAAIDDDLAINREDGAAVTAEFVEIVVRMKAV